MAHEAESQAGSALEQQEGHGQDLVSIQVNGVEVRIHRGRRSVAEIKAAGGVPQGDVLEQQVDGQLTRLPDDGHVVIKGHEVFVSYPRACSSA